jgi:hypothetical protein
LSAELGTLTIHQFRTLVSRYEVHHQNCIVVSDARPPTCLSSHERAELTRLKQREHGLPNFHVPAEEELVIKYNTCTSYNVIYRSAEQLRRNGVVRDCFVAYDFEIRVYGEILFFLKLRIQDQPHHFLYIAYVDWFRQTVDDPWSIWRTHPSRDIILDRAIPISEIVCKIALVAESVKGQKCAVLELL